MKHHFKWISYFVVLAVASACSGNHGGQITEPPDAASVRFGDAELVCRWAPLIDLDLLPASILDRLRSNGITLDGDTLVFPGVPLRHGVVTVGSVDTPIDSAGQFEVRAAADEVVEIHLQGPTSAVLARISASQLSTNRQAPSQLRLPLSIDGIPEMSTGANEKPRPATGDCTTRTPCIPFSNVGPGCCLDYNGPSNDPEQDGVLLHPPIRRISTEPLCLLTAVQDFLGSTCFGWAFERQGACLAEFIRQEEDERGGRCWLNHKYRNCQNLDDSPGALTVKATEALSGGSYFIDLHNNTPGNETYIDVIEGGPLLANAIALEVGGSLKAPVPGEKVVVEHYSDQLQLHYEDVKLHVNVASATQPVRIRFMSWGLAREVLLDPMTKSPSFVMSAELDGVAWTTDDVDASFDRSELAITVGGHRDEGSLGNHIWILVTRRADEPLYKLFLGDIVTPEGLWYRGVGSGLVRLSDTEVSGDFSFVGKPLIGSGGPDSIVVRNGTFRAPPPDPLTLNTYQRRW